MPTKDELEAALAKAEKKVTKLEERVADLEAGAPAPTADASPVFGGGAVPLEQR
jgi:hypothetical protein